MIKKPLLVNGKKPLSSKPSQAKVSRITNPDELFGNALTIPPHIKKELEEKGLEARFVDANLLYKNQGYHEKGWVPYKCATMQNNGFKLGNDPEGIIRRGSVILAVKPKEEAEKHRAFINARRERLQGHQHTQGAELKKLGASSSVDVIEGYGDEDGE